MTRGRLILIIGILALLSAGGAAVVLLSDWKKRAAALVGQSQFDSLMALFGAAEAANGIPTDLLARQGWQESDFDPAATNPSGAAGIMQFEPATAAQFGVDPLNPASAIPGAAQYLSQLHNQFGSWTLALAAYDAGPGNVTKYGGVPPFAETQNYVAKILVDVPGVV
jgi:peptidoglycan DL-endopeptidase CwlO